MGKQDERTNERTDERTNERTDSLLELAGFYPAAKNPKFLSNQADIQVILPSQQLVILTKFHKDWQEDVDSLVIAKLCVTSNFFISLYLHILW